MQLVWDIHKKQAQEKEAGHLMAMGLEAAQDMETEAEMGSLMFYPLEMPAAEAVLMILLYNQHNQAQAEEKDLLAMGILPMEAQEEAQSR